MSDPRLSDLLTDRADRGEPRGADQVWADATEPNYVAPLPRLRRGARPVAIGAAAATIALVVGVVALIGGEGDRTMSLLDGGDPEAPATCLVEPTETSQRSLEEWAEELSSIPGVTSATPHHVPGGGTHVLFTHGFEPIQIPQGARMVSFTVRPTSAVDHLAGDPDIGDLTCHSAPEWAYIPDQLPEGTEVLIVFLDPQDDDSGRDAYSELLGLLERDSVHAAELTPREVAWEEFQQLFADTPEMIEAVDVESLPERVDLLVDASSATALEAEVSAVPGIYRVLSAEDVDQ